MKSSFLTVLVCILSSVQCSFHDHHLRLHKSDTKFANDPIHETNINYYIFSDGSNSFLSDNVSISTLQNHQFQKSKPLKVIIHGFLSNGNDTFVYSLAKSYRSVGIENVIAIDYSTYARNYEFMVANKYQLAHIMASDLMSLSQHQGIPFSKMHLIGHSFGAQLAGLIGKLIQRADRNQIIDRITGLDPAAPLFTSTPDIQHLTKDDAVFVDVIHTSRIGYDARCGTVDFWPNGGLFQIGCNIFSDCSHLRSVWLFEESIRSKSLIARSCVNYKNFQLGLCNSAITAVMGEWIDRNTLGTFYLNTKSKSPFAM